VSQAPKTKKKRYQIPVRLKFTREGKWFTGITLAVGFAAINTGNNLLYLLLGMMLSLIVISGILCNISLRGLKVERQLPRRVFAGAPCLVSLSVTNQKRFFPSFSIEVEDRLEEASQKKRCYFLKIGTQKTQQTAYRLTLPRRGWVHFSELRISSKFPFSLFEKTRIVQQEEQLLVFPQIDSVSLPAALMRPMLGFASSAQKGQGSDFFALREMQPGDELHWIHWPSTARSGVFQVREFEDEQQQQMELFLWHVRPKGPQIRAAGGLGQSIDPAVNFAASLLVALSRQNRSVQFATFHETFLVSDTTGPLEHALAHLALLEAHPPPTNRNVPAMSRSGVPLVIVPRHCAASPACPREHCLLPRAA
jgi:uncharacterized protein (DUF58 family)